MRTTSLWPDKKLFRRLILLIALTLLLGTSSLLFSQHASAHVQDAPVLYATDFYQYNYYNKPTSFIGANFTANSTVTLAWHFFENIADSPAGTVTTDANGGFTFKIANMPSIPYLASAQQPEATLIATDAQQLQASLLVDETTVLTSTPQYAAVGDTITVSGGGFATQETINIFFTNTTTGNTLAQTTTTNILGAFSSSFAIPAGTPFDEGLEVVGTTSGLDLFPSLRIVSKMSISPASGPAGAVVTVAGSQFTSGDSVTIYWADVTASRSTTLTTLTVASDGTFQAQVTVPTNAVVGHTYNIRVTGQSSGASIFARFTLSS